MSERPDPTPEGRLLASALKRSGLSGRKAAERAGLSEGRWRQIVSGYLNVSSGVYAPVRAPADTLARMARVVGVEPEELVEAGRQDAADELLKLMGPGEPSDVLDEAEALMREVEVDLPRLSARQLRAVRDMIQAFIGEHVDG